MSKPLYLLYTYPYKSILGEIVTTISYSYRQLSIVFLLILENNVVFYAIMNIFGNVGLISPHYDILSPSAKQTVRQSTVTPVTIIVRRIM